MFEYEYARTLLLAFENACLFSYRINQQLEDGVSQLEKAYYIAKDDARQLILKFGGSVDEAKNFLSSTMRVVGGESRTESQKTHGGDNANAGSGGQSTAAVSSHVEQGSGHDDQSRSAVHGDQTSGGVHNPIDLTQEDDALQRALALSIQEMQRSDGVGRIDGGDSGGGSGGGGGSSAVTSSGGISLEDQELSRALEASLADNRDHLGKMGILVHADPLNPYDRQRKGNTPVGLKNVGNTCWFSAVIQSLFQIPVFRQLILSYQPSAFHEGAELPQCVRFLTELQNLFALLVSSERQYIDPSKAIQQVLHAVSQPLHGQQDISEFTHKLLEWMEDAFRVAAKDKQENPIVTLFTGQCRNEGLTDDHPFVNESKFGAFPLQVQGYAHLHDSLEAAVVNHEMLQETWFTRLPPILVLELSRFKYNQQSSQAEKIHDPLLFDRTLYMDRYLEENKVVVREKRKDVKKLKERMKELQHKLNGYLNYQSRPVSITEVLALVLMFVRGEEAVDCSPRSQDPEEGVAGKKARISLNPVPRHVSATEQRIMEDSLGRWITEMERDIVELRENIATTKNALDNVYTDPSMNSAHYQLHAVMVHQGQASEGHYWAYVRPRSTAQSGSDAQVASKEDAPMDDQCVAKKTAAGGAPPSPDEEVWLKFNDISVTEVKWSEVARESFGGQHNTSAYCLVYISSTLSNQWCEKGYSQLLHEQELFVDRDNMAFRKEMSDYDEKQRVKRAKHIQWEDQAKEEEEENRAEESKEEIGEKPQPLGECSPERMQVDSPPKSSLLLEQLMPLLAAKVEDKQRELCSLLEGQVKDPRVANIVAYSTKCNIPRQITKALVLHAITEEAGFREDLKMLARKEFLSVMSDSATEKNIMSLRHFYNKLCAVCYHTVQAIGAMQKPYKWEAALRHAMQAFEWNLAIAHVAAPTFALDVAMLGKIRRQAVQGVSKKAFNQFENGDVDEAIQLAGGLLLPSLKALSLCVCDEDGKAMETVRETWCQCLVQPSLTEAQQDMLADLLSKMFDDNWKPPPLECLYTPDDFEPVSLAKEYSKALTTHNLC